MKAWINVPLMERYDYPDQPISYIYRYDQQMLYTISNKSNCTITKISGKAGPVFPMIATNSTFVGLQMVRGLMCNHWQAWDPSHSFYLQFYNLASNGTPRRMMWSMPNGVVAMQDYVNFIAGTPDASAFDEYTKYKCTATDHPDMGAHILSELW